MSAEARSLFLPLKETENAIHCSFYTSLVNRLVDRPLTPLDVFNEPVTRQDALAVVLENQTVQLWDLTDDQEGPKMTKRMEAPNTEKKPPTATCASVFSLDLLYSVLQGVGLLSGTFVRGVMGNSAGRVLFFSETQITDGFQAHNCGVRQVEGLLMGSGGGPRPNPSGMSYGAVSPSSASMSSMDSFRYFPPLLGFATMGENGLVYIWHRNTTEYVKTILIEPSCTAKCPALTTVLPLRDGVASIEAMERPCSPTEPVSYSPRTPNASQDRDSQSNDSQSLSSLVYLATNGIGKAIHVYCAETQHEVEASLELEGTFSRTTAVAADGTVCLAAREKVVYAMDYKARRCVRILTTSSCVTCIAFRQPLAIVGCENGKLYTVNTQTGAVLGVTYTRNSSTVRSLHFLYEAMLLTVVDASGIVEVMELPRVFLREATEHGRPTQYCPSAIVLKRVMQLQECRSGGGTAALQRALAAEEHLLLARLTVPEEVCRYLGRQHSIL